MATQKTLQVNDTAKPGVLLMAMELSNKTWRLLFSDGVKTRGATVAARDLPGLGEAIKKAQERLGLSEDCEVVSCYEAGRDGFWIHRMLCGQGVRNYVVDSSSIEVNRRARKAKTDRIDVRKLMNLLQRYVGGDKTVWHVIHVPSVEAEDARRLNRELDRLQKERGAHTNRIRSLLALHGSEVKSLYVKDWEATVDGLRQWDGKPLPARLQEELRREWLRFRQVHEQILAIKAEQRKLLKTSDARDIEQVRQLIQLGAIGPRSAWVFVMEFFAWRHFTNRRQVGGLAGLTGTPHDSGESHREQGISKAGNRRLRAMLIEIAWMWLRYQPNSKLTQWYLKRFAHGGKRLRRIGIVALARRLIIDLWHYLEQGVIPEGAQLKQL